MAIICLYNKGNTANDKNNTVRYYLMVLAICDGLAIFWYSLHLILLGQKPSIHLPWETNCNLSAFVMGCTTEISSLMVMMITVNRFIAIFYPLKFKHLQSVRRIYKCIGIQVLLVFIINWCSFGGLKRIDRAELHTIVYFEYQCRGRTPFIDDYYFKVLPFIHFIVYLIIPGMVLFVLNIAIAMKLRQLRRVTVICSNQENTLEGRLTNLQETQPPIRSGKDKVTGRKDLKENCSSRPHKRLQCNASFHTRVEHGTSFHTRIKPDRTSDARIKPGTSSDAKVEPGTSSNTRIKPDTTSDVGIKPRKPDVKVEPDTSSDPRVEPGTSSDAGVKPGTSSDTRVKPGTSSDTRVQFTGISSGARTQPTTSSDIRVELGTLSYTSVKPETSSDAQVEPGTSSDIRVKPETSIDERG